MKSPNCWKWTLGLCLGVSLFAGGCVKESSSASVQSGAAITAPGPEVVYQATTAEPAPSEAAPGERSAVEATPQLEAPPLTNLVEAAVEPISTNQPPPAKVKLTHAAAELVKLANSGVAETVMLAYVTNSPSTFNLGAEEIIYMNDLGVPAAVVTAMIQQDQALKAAGEAAMAASVEANTPQPPPATAQPQPADVAPQATLPATSVAETPPPPPESEVTTQVY